MEQGRGWEGGNGLGLGALSLQCDRDAGLTPPRLCSVVGSQLWA